MATTPPTIPRNITPEHRPIGGFIFFFAAIGLFTLMSLVVYFATPGDGQSREVFNEELSQAQLQKVIAENQKSAATNLEAARTFAAAKIQQGDDVDKKDIAALSKSTKKIDRIAVEVFTTKKISADRGLVLIKQAGIPKTPYEAFVHKTITERTGNQVSEFGSLSEIPFGLLGFIFFGFCLFCYGIFAFVRFWQRVSNGQITPLRAPGSPMSYGRANALALAGGILLSLHFFNPFQFIKGQNYYLIAIWAPLTLVIAHRFKYQGETIGLGVAGGRKMSPASAIGWGLNIYAALIPVLTCMLILALALQKFFPPASHPLAEGDIPFAAAFLLAVIGAPIVEEHIFRGWIFPALSKLLNSVWAGGVVSSLCFAMIHPQGPTMWPALACIGGTCCLLTHYTRSLWPGMILHAVHNGLLVGMAYTING